MRKVTACFMFFVILMLFGSISAYAAENGDIKVRVNGVTLTSDPMPVIRSERVYVPLRAIAESLNYTVDYRDNIKTATISNRNKEITFSLNDLSATVNGAAVQMPVPAMVLNDRIMVPVRFLTESFDCLVNWMDWSGWEVSSRGLVDIYSDDPTYINGQISISSLYYSLTKPVGDPGGHEISCIYAAPQIHGLSDKNFEYSFNKSFQVSLENVKKEVADGAEDAISTAKEAGYAYDYSYEGGYYCDAIGNDIVTITLDGYTYMGGAHGMGIQSCYVIDINKSAVLSLHDILLPGQASEGAIVNAINNLVKANPDEYGLYDDENGVSADEVFRTSDDMIKSNNFYLEDSNIVIFFQPYEIGPYASGFITFKIPVDEISDYVRPEYLKILH